MATYHKQNSHASKKKVSISYVIREKEERCHRAGVNSLQYDPHLERLYSAGRDSVIRIWSFADKLSNSNNGRGNNSLSYQSDSQANNDLFLQSMEHHTDWVNDITLCCNGRNLISVSNDTTIKVWNAHQGYCLSTLRSHKDYAKCLAYAKDREVIASAGFDRMIYLWDIQALTMLTTTKNTVTTKPLDGSKNSIYSLAINQCGTLVASGSTEKVIRLWDPRSRQKLLKLRGHTDNVKSLLFSKDGSLLLSASSDGTIRLWSIAQQRCISIIRVHDEGVWTLQTNEAFNIVYSGGKDCKIFMTDLKNTSNTTLVCEEKAPILKILLVDRSYSESQSRAQGKASLWVTTTDSAIKNWNFLSPKDQSTYVRGDRDVSSIDNNNFNQVSMNSKPALVIRGKSAVINYHVLNDKRHILTRESDNSVALYDVLTARKIANLHPPVDIQSKAKENYEMEVKKRSKMVYVPNWFTVDLKIGLLCIHLEESECFSAWVSARDYGFIPQVDGQDPKVNLGCLMLQALFEHWHLSHSPIYERGGYESDMVVRTNRENRNAYQHYKSAQLDDGQKSSLIEENPSNGVSQRTGNQYFSVPKHTPVIISEGNQTLLKISAYEVRNGNEEVFLQEIMAPWISDVLISKCQPKFTKIPFFLLPHANSGIKSLRKERLSASDMLQMRKVIEHVCEKMIVNVMEENNNSTSTNQDQSGGSKISNMGELNTLPIDKVELYCNDQKLDESWDLRTVKHFIWKAGGDLVLHYMPIK